MKKALIFGTFALLGLASCKKDYTCTCTTTAEGPQGTVTSSASATINDTKKNAETSCDEGDATSTAGGYTSTVECTLQ